MDPARPIKSSRPVSAIRKIRKPIIEKKRRERINVSLEELKDMLLVENAVQHRNRKPSKLEKADILEQTVQHVRELQQALRSCPAATPGCDQPAAQAASSSDCCPHQLQQQVDEAFRRGFQLCLNTVKAFGSDTEDDQHSSCEGKLSEESPLPSLPGRLVHRLESCLQRLPSLHPHTSSTAEDDGDRRTSPHHLQQSSYLPPSPLSVSTPGSPDLSCSRSGDMDGVSPAPGDIMPSGLRSWLAGSDTDYSCDASVTFSGDDADVTERHDQDEEVLDLSGPHGACTTSRADCRECMWRPW